MQKWVPFSRALSIASQLLLFTTVGTLVASKNVLFTFAVFVGYAFLLLAFLEYKLSVTAGWSLFAGCLAYEVLVIVDAVSGSLCYGRLYPEPEGLPLSTLLVLLIPVLFFLILIHHSFRRQATAKSRSDKGRDEGFTLHDGVPLNYKRLALCVVAHHSGVAICSSGLGMLLRFVLSWPPSAAWLGLLPLLVITVLYANWSTWVLRLIWSRELLVADSSHLRFRSAYSTLSIRWTDVDTLSFRSAYGSKILVLRLKDLDEALAEDSLQCWSKPSLLLVTLVRVNRFLDLVIRLLQTREIVSKVLKGGVPSFGIGRPLSLEREPSRRVYKEAWQANYEKCGFHIILTDIFAENLEIIARTCDEMVKKTPQRSGNTLRSSDRPSATQ